MTDLANKPQLLQLPQQTTSEESHSIPSTNSVNNFLKILPVAPTIDPLFSHQYTKHTGIQTHLPTWTSTKTRASKGPLKRA